MNILLTKFTLKTIVPALVMLVVAAFQSTSASADLFKRPGGFVYDRDIDITWLADANGSNTYNWVGANDWANNLGYGGFNDWRLPSARDIYTGELCQGNVDSISPCINEMGHLFREELGGFTGATLVDLGLDDGDPFYNVSNTYWLAEKSSVTADANLFWFQNEPPFGPSGRTRLIYMYQSHHHAWAVRDGDVIAPFAVDIKPATCPNALNLKSKGVLPVAIAGTIELDVTQIDVASVRLNGVAPVRSAIKDVTVEFYPPNCVDYVVDGINDLTLKFDSQEIVATLGEVEIGDIVTLTLTGNLSGDTTTIFGQDSVVIVGKIK